ncbi:glycoside hydrolase family 43 protein [Mucilaginibacter sp. Mucisp86]|uniref:glycoside hydrolase family 43 protein n=1 Tax=Mucilaginibacter sp. Mucisp86 TaxID=3243060 RepID=UPI0039B653FF
MAIKAIVAYIIYFLGFFILWTPESRAQSKVDSGFFQGQRWKDSQGNPINAHGAGVLYYKDKYYLYGEIKKGQTTLVPGQIWDAYRVPAGGVSCYSSFDLKHWKYEGVALLPNTKDTSSDLHVSRVIERPKVIFNEKTKKFVMWMHIDKEDYAYARVGVAISDSPQGPFRFLGSFRPNGNESRDMTVFKDLDNSGYLIYSSEGNAIMHICKLSSDYLSVTKNEKRMLVWQSREAPVIIRNNKKYFLITSKTTGWSPNEAMYAVADKPLGNWKVVGNPCTGSMSETTYNSQGTFALPLTNGQFLFMADRWNMKDLENSGYVWLPMTVEEDRLKIVWQDVAFY